MKKDLSKQQFLAALKKNGITPSGFMGYCDLGNGVHASRFNAGKRLRDQLKYLLKEQARNAKPVAIESTGPTNEQVNTALDTLAHEMRGKGFTEVHVNHLQS